MFVIWMYSSALISALYSVHPNLSDTVAVEGVTLAPERSLPAAGFNITATVYFSSAL